MTESWRFCWSFSRLWRTARPHWFFRDCPCCFFSTPRSRWREGNGRLRRAPCFLAPGHPAGHPAGRTQSVDVTTVPRFALHGSYVPTKEAAKTAVWLLPFVKEGFQERRDLPDGCHPEKEQEGRTPYRRVEVSPVSAPGRLVRRGVGPTPDDPPLPGLYFQTTFIFLRTVSGHWEKSA